jgi:prevent-host-death family protein
MVMNDDDRKLERREAAAVYQPGRPDVTPMWPDPDGEGLATRPHLVLSAADFKARCLALMDEIEQHGGEITITKRGKPVAKLVPATPKTRRSLKGSVLYTADDIHKPLGLAWRLGGE